MSTRAAALAPAPPRRRSWIPYGALALLPLVLALAVALGTETVPLGDTLRLALAALGLGDAESVDATHRVIVGTIRTPRVAILALAGAGLAISGAALQATFQNAMAEPGLLGVTSGAALGAVIAFYSGLSDSVFLSLPAFAFVGAMSSSFLVYYLAHAGGRPSTTSLLLTGVAVGALMSAISTLIQTWSDYYRLQEILFWLVGGARDRTWVHAAMAAPPIALGSVVLLGLHRRVDALAMGEEHALSVGVPVHRARLGLLFWSALVAGAAVSVCGPIGFVGLMVPHIVRLAVGPRSLILLPTCLLVGAQFLVACDLGARLISGQRVVYLGVVTAFLGVPFFLFLLIRTQRGR